MRVLSIVAFLFSSSLLSFGQFSQERAAMIDHEVKALEFIGGGSPLTAQERQEASQVVDLGMRMNAAHWRQADLRVQQTLAGIAQGNEKHRVYIWEQWRYNYGFPPRPDLEWVAAFAVEKRIIEAHDPPIATDVARKLLVTEHMLPSLRRISTWVAQIYGLAPPRPDFESIVRDNLRQHFTAMGPAVAEGLAHIEEDAPFTINFFSTPKERLVRYVAATRKDLDNAQDPRAEQLNLAVLAGVMSRFATTHGGVPRPDPTTPEGKLQQSKERFKASQMMLLCGPGVSEVQRVQNGCVVP